MFFFPVDVRKVVVKHNLVITTSWLMTSCSHISFFILSRFSQVNETDRGQAENLLLTRIFFNKEKNHKISKKQPKLDYLPYESQ